MSHLPLYVWILVFNNLKHFEELFIDFFYLFNFFFGKRKEKKRIEIKKIKKKKLFFKNLTVNAKMAQYAMYLSIYGFVILNTKLIPNDFMHWPMVIYLEAIQILNTYVWYVHRCLHKFWGKKSMQHIWKNIFKIISSLTYLTLSLTRPC